MRNLFNKALAYVGMDGLLHIVISAIIASVLQLCMPVVLAIVLTLAIGLAKECIYDGAMGKGSPTKKDMLCNAAGVVIVILNHL